MKKFKNIQNVIIIILIFIILIGGSYLTSELSYYKKSCILEEQIDLLKEAYNKITFKDYSNLLHGKEVSLVYIGKKDCIYTKKEDLVFESLLKDYKFEINYLDLDTLSIEELNSLYSTIEDYEKEGLSTPTIMLVGSDNIIMYKKGYSSQATLLKLFEKNNFKLGD